MRNSFSGALCALAFLVVSHVSTAQELDCAKFQTGKFIIRDADLGEMHLTRTEKTQTERGVDPVTGKKYKAVFSIVWIDACTYDLRLINQKNSNLPSDTPTLRIKILETYETSYKAFAPDHPEIAPFIIEQVK